MILLITLVFGLLIGSFLNVCIARLPQDQSVVRPPSHCPRCNSPIKWYDNVPIVSFLLLGARCRACGLPISWRYPFVELLNGLLYALTVQVFGIGGETLLVLALCSSLVVITFIDFDHQIIPDVITLPGIVIGLAAAPFFMTDLLAPLPFGLDRFLPGGAYLRALANSALGLLAGGGTLYVIGWTWQKLRNIEAMGGGDIKLMAMVGSLIGWKGALLTIMLGALFGALAGGGLMLFKKHEAGAYIPFGPFLAAGALLALFAGPEILDWYFGLLPL